MGYLTIFIIAAIIGVLVAGWTGILAAILAVVALAFFGKAIWASADKLDEWFAELWRKILGR